MAKDKKDKGKAAPVKYSITPGPQANKARRHSAEGTRARGESRPPPAGAAQRRSMDVYGNAPPASASASSQASAHRFNGGFPSRPSSAAGRSVHSYGSDRHVSMPPLGYHPGYYPRNEEEDDYVERDLAEFGAAHDEAIMRYSATSPVPPYPYQPPPAAGGRPPSSAGSHSHAGGGGGGGGGGGNGRMYGTPPPFSPLGIGAGRPPPPPLEIGSVYSGGSGSRSGAGQVGYGSYGFYAEAPTAAAAGGGYSAYGYDYATSPHPESITSGDMQYNDGYYGGAYPFPNEYAQYHHQQQGYPASSTAGASYPDLYSPSPEDAPPGMFGVSAPHHTPGAAAAQQRAAVGPRYGGDLPGFPTWSRNWYGGHLSADGHAYTTIPPNSSASGWESETLTNSMGTGPGARHGPYGRAYGAAGVDDHVKEERMRMLEKEFGPKVRHRGEKDDDSDAAGGDDGAEDDESDLLPGSLTRAGKVVHSFPKLVLLTRILQVSGSLATLAVGVGGALLVKVPTDTAAAPAPPKGTIPSFVLYGAAAVATIVTLYLFVFRPCCCDPMKRKAAAGGPVGMNGMVVPIMAGGGQQQKKGKLFGGKGKKGMGPGGTTTVNLIVDPSMLNGGKGQDLSDDDDFDSEDEEAVPGEARRRKRRRRAKKQKLLNAQLQGRWMIARKDLKLVLTWDVILAILLLGASIIAIGVGKKCPSGGGGGWCDWYNGAIAAACITAVCFLLAIWWDVSALRASAKGPRPGLAGPV